MQFIKPDINLDFIGKRRIAMAISLTVILISILSIAFHKGLKYGVDFSGGTSIQVKFHSIVNINDIKSGLASIGIKESVVQQFGDQQESEYLINTDQPIVINQDFTKKAQDALKSATKSKSDIRRIEMVGPQVGKDLREKALFAIFYSLLFVSIYISGRFEFKWFASGIMTFLLIGAIYSLSVFKVSVPFLILVALIVTLAFFYFLDLRYAMGAIVALIHDVTITIGFFSMFGKEFNLPIVAAILTIIGYSLNDTIIVFDRIRENLKKYHKDTLAVIINKSINETLSRTILTSLTVLIVVFSLFFLGGGIIHDFAFAWIVGVLTGTYSSVFIASPIILDWPERKKKKI